MTRPRVVHILHIPNGVDPADVVYIGRTMAGKHSNLKDQGWGNPFKSGDALGKYRTHLRNSPDLIARIQAGELRGKVLACWCKWADLAVPCHGDVLADLVEALENKDL